MKALFAIIDFALKVLKHYALQLISLLPDIFKEGEQAELKLEDVLKKKLNEMLETPYGLQLKWTLPGGTPFILHLKDNHKVPCLLF